MIWRVAEQAGPPYLPRRTTDLPPGYAELLEELKERIAQSQVRAALAANRELLRLYWLVGRLIVTRQRAEGWGRSVIDRLAEDLRRSLPGVSGFSVSNLWRMQAFHPRVPERGCHPAGGRGRRRADSRAGCARIGGRASRPRSGPSLVAPCGARGEG